jgi:murein DD-endopeptidase MepM/ murein hydrolase activator NlpD
MPNSSDTPLQDWANGVDRSLSEPFAQLTQQLEEVKQTVDAIATSETAKLERRSTLFLLGLMLAGVAWIQVGHPLIRGIAQTAQQGQQQVEQVTKPITETWKPADLAKTLKVGDSVSGYPVTSGFGPRSSPGGIGSTNHEGVDIATPSGTQIYAPFDIEVRDASSSGCGTGARVSSPHLKGFEVGLCHLSKLQTGKVSKGQVFALSGGTPGTSGAGASTGPHLHIGWFDPQGNPTNPPAAIAWAFITGNAPDAKQLGGNHAGK